MNRRKFFGIATTAVTSPIFAEDQEALARRLASDPHRPRYHLLAPRNWMNDPNAPISWKGRYHVFYQWNPTVSEWGNIHWGHAVSSDMIHWKHMPMALAGTPGGTDQAGVYTGSAVVDNGVPTILYTAARTSAQMLATAEDDSLNTWKKYEGNPVVRPPAGLKLSGFRDPAVWKEGETWYMIVGAGFKDEGGSALLFRSPDLRKWEYMHPLHTGKIQKAEEPGLVMQDDMWECPDFFPLGNKHVLLASTARKNPYFVGAYRDHQFVTENQGHTDFRTGYAAKTMIDAKGRRILWTWVRERRKDALFKAAGWAGAIGLPRVLTLLPGNVLGMDPIPELSVLRGRRKQFHNISVEQDEQVPLQGAPGDCSELVAEIEPGTAEEFGLKLRATPDDTEHMLFGYSAKEKVLFSDTRRSSLNPDTSRAIQKGFFELQPGEALKLHIFLDGSVVEVFVNGRACFAERVYPTRTDSLETALFSRGGTSRLRSMDVWELQPISPDRLTT
jgi:beta-fructofuranosidase